MTSTTERLRVLNDQLRTSGHGGTVILTRGIAALLPDKQREIRAAVQAFGDFKSENNIYDEHDFASLTAADQKIVFKIEYYDRTMMRYSPNPSDPFITKRVLTIMLATES